MGCLLSCLGPMKRDAGAYRRIATEDNSGRFWQNLGANHRSRHQSNHAFDTGIESSLLMQDRRLGVNMEYNTDMYGVGWRDCENPIIRLATVSEEIQRADNNKHNDMSR